MKAKIRTTEKGEGRDCASDENQDEGKKKKKAWRPDKEEWGRNDGWEKEKRREEEHESEDTKKYREEENVIVE